ncbi:hypothetical protein PIB30_093019 [Stylosanthes scabra]|uniref:DUF4283 domain-containing protein n=1 Tax=Stylosanthes scabra TaxID=79078 RepID=A0ABU6TXD6_9FABA|nr:hypothetical protein [Stylosanthes scabra]
MGSQKLVLIFESKQGMEEAAESSFLLNRFMDVGRCTTGEANRSRRKWLEVFGLSVHAWCKNNMRKVVEVWGLAISLEEKEEEHFNSFKVLVDAGTGPTIQARLTVAINGEEFSIFVKEVCAMNAENGIDQAGATDMAVKERGDRGTKSRVNETTKPVEEGVNGMRKFEFGHQEER